MTSVALAVAPNGGRKVKADHPAVPLTPAELAVTAARCLEAGASMIHAHVRASDGTHLLDAGAYLSAISAIRGAVGDRLVIQITSEALGRYAPAQQRAVIRDVRPEAASLALRELVPDASEEGAFAELLGWMKREAVTPQIILYDIEDALHLVDFRKRGLVPFERLPVLFVLGRYTTGQTSNPRDLLPFIDAAAPVFEHWSVCAFGAQEIACVTTAALLGGHVRVGFENNELLPDGSRAQGNEDLVAAARRAIEAVGLTHATADDLRAATAN
ncbi:MAG: 3-keto-5-aminohexanoate cleavage enzyme [Tardiphaga sp.]|uniref:3-keto-5-aminohexanoate cleavage protein n=1 Tax=Tardiphaga sp. TaxID=1926292 RepID=UPI00261CAF2A|nr:3-keto-5-aminohexanoate cleavage protein [Tardiphaga sp.]MDB5502421.1 3-keto-5-aminohexanoate cleavage enzyme [Tardiphaga sp.]